MAHHYSKLPWCKNFLKIPSWITEKIESFENRPFVISCSKIISNEDFEKASYEHLMIDNESNLSNDWTRLFPSPNVGRASHYNITFNEKPDKSHTKVTKKIHGKAPNRDGISFHPTVYWRDVWPTKLIPPNLRSLSFRSLSHSSETGGVIVEFRIDETLQAESETIEKDLLECLNLLQENVGKVDLFEINAKESELIRVASEDIGWKILSHENPEDTYSEIFTRLQNRPNSVKQKAKERLKAILALSPIKIMQGSYGFVGYFAAQFTDDLVVFENLEINNAIYVVKGNWKMLSKMSRSELRTLHCNVLRRIVHSANWKTELEQIVSQERGQPYQSDSSLI